MDGGEPIIKEIEKEAEEKNKTKINHWRKQVNNPQKMKTRIHWKTNQKTKPCNTKSQNEYDDGQDEPQKWL